MTKTKNQTAQSPDDNHTGNKYLDLPRPLVNRILAHAQQCADDKTSRFNCGIISTNAKGKKFYYPLTSPGTGSANTRDSKIESVKDCFDTKAQAFESVRKLITERQEDILAHVFTTAEDIAINPVNEHLFPHDQHYYVMNSLNTEGVLSMQGFFREGTSLLKVDLALENSH